MTRNYWIYGAVLIAGLLVLVFWPHPARHEPSPTQSGNEPEQHTESGPPSTNTPAQAVRAANPAAPSVVQRQETTNQTEPRKRVDMLRQALGEKNVPIDFYGRVIDQDAAPVAAVKLRVYVRHWELTSDAMSQPVRMERETDADGRFDIHGATGDAVDVEAAEKPGYQLSPVAQHSYGPSSGTPDGPTVIKMWRQGAREPLVGGDKVFGIVPDGRIYTLDLLTGKKTEGEANGDVRVSIVRPAGVKPRDKYEWSWRIEGIQGGLLETGDEFMYLAPDAGYEPKVGGQLSPGDPAWTPSVKKRLFISSRNGKVFCRMQVEINALYNDHSAIEVSYAANPNGSRNLQP